MDIIAATPTEESSARLSMDRSATRSTAKRVLRRVASAPSGTASVTVVVPCYNYGRFLGECAQSALGQKGVEVRLVIIDDASTDDTTRVCDALTQADSRVSVIRHVHNRGHIPSVNEGLAQVETDYVVKLDADDLLAPGALARATALLEAFPHVAFVYGRPLHFSGEVPKRAKARIRSWTIWPGADWVARRCRDGESAISQPEVVIRTAHLREVGAIRSDLPDTSDLHLWLRLASTGDVGRLNGPIQGYYRIHEASMQRTVHAGELFRLRGRRAAFDAALDAAAEQLSGAPTMLATVHRALAAEALDRAAHRIDRGRPAADGERVDDFVAFATETWPQARQLRQWVALERRRALGDQVAPRRPSFVAAAARRRARTELRRWRLRHTGEF